MAEAAKSVSDYLNNGENMLFINVITNLSVDCDCIANPAKPDMHDVGILASLDPVVLDQACVDLVYAAPDGQSVIERMESRMVPIFLNIASKLILAASDFNSG